MFAWPDSGDAKRSAAAEIRPAPRATRGSRAEGLVSCRRWSCASDPQSNDRARHSAGRSRRPAHPAVQKNRMLQVSMATNATMFTSMEDRALLDAAKHLVIEEHLATAALLRALMEIDTRRLYLGEGCASMFSYCTQVLHLAEGAAYNRIEAARAARSHPLILELFEQGAITLTAVRLLAPHLTAENHVAVLTSATHKSKREIEELACALKPWPDAPMVVRRLPTPRAVLAQTKASFQAHRRRPESTRHRLLSTADASAVLCQNHRQRQSCGSPPNAIGFSSPSRARHTTVPAGPGTAASRGALGGRRRCFRSGGDAPGRPARAPTLRPD